MALHCSQCGNRVASKRNLVRHLSHAHRIEIKDQPWQPVPVNVPVQRAAQPAPTIHTPVQPQTPRRVESGQPSPFDLIKQALSGAPRPAVANVTVPKRYQRIAEIPPELLAKHRITKQGNALNAPAGVDLAAVLRLLLK
jgi:hypothetical protein